jgi:hypothetical protein
MQTCLDHPRLFDGRWSWHGPAAQLLAAVPGGEVGGLDPRAPASSPPCYLDL